MPPMLGRNFKQLGVCRYKCCYRFHPKGKFTKRGLKRMRAKEKRQWEREVPNGHSTDGTAP